MWGGKVILKGILDEEDAIRAADLGADAIVVSNHGGRQLDGALSSIRMLEPIAKAVGDGTEVWLDGGVRSGQDVLKAVALGAKGAMIGRSFVYGLGAMGEAGVTAALDIIRNELDISMALCGRRDIADVDRDILLVRKGFPAVLPERAKIPGGPAARAMPGIVTVPVPQAAGHVRTGCNPAQ